MRRSPSATARAGGRHRRRSPWSAAAAVPLVVALSGGGGGLLVAGITVEPPRPPQPPVDAAPPDPAADGFGAPEAVADHGAAEVAMRRSPPVRITIPAIGVDATLISLGVDEHGEVEVPALDKAMDAGWYELGPTPGEIGNAVIIGHVDSREHGPAVFFELGRLEPGTTIEVVRADGSVARFRVDGVRSFPKDEFPSEQVYGPSDHAGLRVVTCGGRFDRQTGGYLSNVIAFATLRP